MQKIIPNLWFDGAKEAIDFYVSAFPDSRIIATVKYPNSVEEGLADFQLDMAGKELTIEFELAGTHFTAINAGPMFKFNPSVSFMVSFDPSIEGQSSEDLDALWARLIDGGEALMPLDEYPFSKRYGWVKDRFGLTWQLLMGETATEPWPRIMPCLMFAGDKVNKAEEAMQYYLSVFKSSKAGTLARYAEATGPAKAGSIMYADFNVEGQWLAVMDAGAEMDAPFNEAVSLSVNCADQAEIDYFWERLSTVPEAEQCGWCKDAYGVSWQIVPANMEELMSRPGAYSKMMQMHKLVIADF